MKQPSEPISQKSCECREFVFLNHGAKVRRKIHTAKRFALFNIEFNIINKFQIFSKETIL